MTSRQAVHAGAVVVTEVDPWGASTEEAGAWAAFDALLCEECPRVPFEQGRMHLLMAPAFLKVRLFVASNGDGALVGEARAVVWRDRGPRQTCRVYLTVHPGRRRRGIARALLARIAQAAEEEGQTLLSGRTTDRVPSGEVFARRLGADVVDEGVTSKLRIADVDWVAVRAWMAAAAARLPDYELCFAAGACPADLIDQAVVLHGELYASVRGEHIGPGRSLSVAELRAIERASGPRSQRWSLFARHRPTGALAGLTEVGYHPDEPDSMYQSGTVVAPAHRGRGLAKWMKAAMIERIAAGRPGVEEILTANAVRNAAIVAINRALGFRPWMATTSWRIPVTRVRVYLARGGAG